MLQIRKSTDRGFADHGWLKSRHTFSFAEYYAPEQMGFRTLRVINEDRIEGGTGFGSHPHRDMEIISYVVKGALEHQDSMGTKAIIRPGEVQRMSAGSGVVHSEYNQLADQETHFFQIWILPRERGGTPGYGQRSFERELQERKLVLAVSGDGREGSIAIKQDADMYIARMMDGDSLSHALKPGRGAWVQVVSGEFEVNGRTISAGDGLAIENEPEIKLKALRKSELILFDLV